MKFQILITQYNETEEIINPMLQSINLQQGIDLKNDIEVIIGNDGSNIILSDEYLAEFNYPIKYLMFEHSGLPGTRAKLFEVSSADYIMFCDADDMFYNALGISIIMNYIKKGFDALTSKFYEEIHGKDKNINYIAHDNDITFVHGKVYRRQYLVDNNIIWHPELKGHEDSCFNTVARNLTNNYVYCNTPFYLWKWREDSISRNDKLYLQKTYPYLIDSSEQMIFDFLDRSKIQDAIYVSNICLYYCYFSMNDALWDIPESKEYKEITRKRFKEFYTKHLPLINSIKTEQKLLLIQNLKNKFFAKGVFFENITFNDWLNYILSDDDETTETEIVDESEGEKLE